MQWESGEIVADEIETFVTGVRPVARAERVLAAVLFTDLVGSTKRAREFGDRRWRRVLDEYERASSEEIDRFRGRLVKNTGDGALATFGSASDAIGCVLAIERGIRRLGLEIHSGIHVGDVERRGDDIGGSTVNIAARVMSAAAGGEILLTMAAYEAAAGSGIRFSAAGEHSLKGLRETPPAVSRRAWCGLPNPRPLSAARSGDHRGTGPLPATVKSGTEREHRMSVASVGRPRHIGTSACADAT